MSELSFYPNNREPYCQDSAGIYYATGRGMYSIYLGSELPGADLGLDFLAITRQVEHTIKYDFDGLGHFVISKLCMNPHKSYDYKNANPGPQLEQMANVVIGNSGAQPFRPVIANVRNFPFVFNAAGIGDPKIDTAYRLETLPAIGEDHHSGHRYTRENPPVLAIEAGRRDRYYCLDNAVDALILCSSDGELTLANNTWMHQE